jgi:hypothetical protein
MEGISREEIEARLRRVKPNWNESSIRVCARELYRTLNSPHSEVVLDPELTANEIARRTPYSKRHVGNMRYIARLVGILPKYKPRKKYTKEDLLKADERFPTPYELRRSIASILFEPLSVGEIADRLGIPKLPSTDAKSGYGIKYPTYRRLIYIIRWGLERGYLKRIDGKYRLLDAEGFLSYPLRRKIRREPNIGELAEGILASWGVEEEYREKLVGRTVSQLELFRKRGLLRGRKLKSAVREICYLACRQEGVPVPYKPSKLYLRIYDFLNGIPTGEPERYLPVLCKRLKVREEICRKAYRILSMLPSNVRYGKSEIGLACAALYIALEMAGEKVTQVKVCEPAYITIRTLRSRVDDIKKELPFLAW